MIQEPGIGEIRVASAVLPFCAPPIVLVTDYKGLISGFAAGCEATTGPGKKYAEAWRDFWDIAEDFGLEAISFCKIRAHLFEEEMRRTEGVTFRD